jgi:UDP-N-acetylmuramoyl-tripeptide--D-alanyl-D-alanine ligase
LAAIAVARRFNIDEEKIARALASAALPEMRLEQRHCFLSNQACEGATTIVADCYNANPDSMLAAIETVATLGDGSGGAGGRRVVVLGDMLELGAQADSLHRQVLERIRQLDEEATTRIGLVVLVGEQMRRASAVLTEAHWPASRVVCVAGVEDAALADAVAALLMPGDLVLLKGSRRMGLERVLRAVERRAAGVAPGAAAAGPRRAVEEHGAPGGAGVTGVKGRVPTKT